MGKVCEVVSIGSTVSWTHNVAAEKIGSLILLFCFDYVTVR